MAYHPNTSATTVIYIFVEAYLRLLTRQVGIIAISERCSLVVFSAVDFSY